MNFKSFLMLLLAPILMLNCNQQAKESSAEAVVTEEVVKDVTNEIVEANQVFINHFIPKMDGFSQPTAQLSKVGRPLAASGVAFSNWESTALN